MVDCFTDEEDIFESDFDSTDEEAPQTGVEAGEQLVEEEEKRARKVGSPSCSIRLMLSDFASSSNLVW